MAWRLNAGNETEVMDARGRNVARAHCGGSYGVKLDEAEAHARLIAAAPDLLAVLEAVTACLRGFHAADDFGPLDDEAIDAALAVIAQAKGKA